jgi:hypothetical protein
MSNPQYAPNPKNQKVYRNLQNKKLSDVTAKDIQQLTDPTFIQATNQDALITYNMLNKAMMRDGLPIPNQGKIIATEFTGATQTKIVASANNGEVYQVIGASGLVTAGSGTAVFVLGITDGTNTVRIESLSFTGNNEFNITSTAGPIYVDENLSLSVVSSGGSFPTSADCLIALQRVR